MFVLQFVFIYQRLGALAASAGGEQESFQPDTPSQHRQLSEPNPEFFKKSFTKFDFCWAGNVPGSVPVLAMTWCFFQVL